MKRCDYCGQATDEVRCPGCQSENFDSKPVNQIVRGEPFHFNGYVVWWLADAWLDSAEYLFYLGDRLVERFTISREVLNMFVPENCPAMPFIWDIFMVAQSEEEVLRVVEQNTIKPATFEITRKPSVEEEYASELSMQAINEAVIAGRRIFGYRR